MAHSQVNSVFVAETDARTVPIYLVCENETDKLSLPAFAFEWMKSMDFIAKAGQILVLPDQRGNIYSVLFGLGQNDDPFLAGKLTQFLPEGQYRLEGPASDLTYLGLALGGYQYARYQTKKSKKTLQYVLPETMCQKEIQRRCDSIFMVRDMINTPANDMGPEHIENAVREIAQTYGADVESICGDDLLKHNFPMIHAVGRAGDSAPRLIEMNWGSKNHPTVTLVGKGVAFDTGGLDIKPASGMLLMKKDMGGAANVLGLARMVMDAKLPLRLKLLIPAVENAIAGNAFRPGDVLHSRKGLSVEVGNTDAEGRLVLADALSYGDEKSPQLMIDMATLTGAARVALGPDLPPFYCENQVLSDKILRAAHEQSDPLWRLPLWKPYATKLSSRIADLNNVTSDGFAGSITAALFLKRFVEKAENWAHFDIYGWTPVEKPGFPVGGEAQGIRALYEVLKGL